MNKCNITFCCNVLPVYCRREYWNRRWSNKLIAKTELLNILAFAWNCRASNNTLCICFCLCQNCSCTNAMAWNLSVCQASSSDSRIQTQLHDASATRSMASTVSYTVLCYCFRTENTLHRWILYECILDLLTKCVIASIDLCCWAHVYSSVSRCIRFKMAGVHSYAIIFIIFNLLNDVAISE